jgi:hypothetical protein
VIIKTTTSLHGVCLRARDLLQLGQVIGHVPEVAHVQADLQEYTMRPSSQTTAPIRRLHVMSTLPTYLAHVQAHLDNVLVRRAVVARLREALERGRQVSELVVELAQIVVAHLRDQIPVSLVPYA